MQIGEENQAFAEVDVLRLDGLLDLDHHVGLAPGVAGVADHLRAGVLVLGVGKTGLRAGLGLDQNLVAGFGERLYASRRNANARFVVLDFFGNADDHDRCSFTSFRRRGGLPEVGTNPGNQYREGCSRTVSQLEGILRRK